MYDLILMPGFNFHEYAASLSHAYADVNFRREPLFFAQWSLAGTRPEVQDVVNDAASPNISFADEKEQPEEWRSDSEPTSAYIIYRNEHVRMPKHSALQ